MFKHAWKPIVLALGMIFLVGCATQQIEGFTDLPGEQQVYVLKTDLANQLDVLKAYRAQPRCSETVVVGCYEPELFADMVAAAVRADEALDLAEAAVRAGASDQATKIAAARAALNTLINKLATRSV